MADLVATAATAAITIPEYVQRVYVKEPVVVAPSFAPAHSLVVVMPGDSWFSICAREYGNSGPWSKVADFNGMPRNVQLTSGMQLRLPVINPDGSFSLSSAPAAIAMAPQGFAGGFPQGLPQGAQFQVSKVVCRKRMVSLRKAKVSPRSNFRWVCPKVLRLGQQIQQLGLRRLRLLRKS